MFGDKKYKIEKLDFAFRYRCIKEITQRIGLIQRQMFN
jgi:hypothetical protein